MVAVSHAGVGRLMRGLCLGLSLDEIRALDTPQDVVFRLTPGAVERFAAASRRRRTLAARPCGYSG